MAKFQNSKFTLSIFSIQHYREEQKITEEKREEMKAKAKMPPGTKLMSEEDREKTLD